MATTRAEQAAQTRRAILRTAGRLFADLGYDATSLQAIADEMGLTKAAVYYYFRTKKEILYELGRRPYLAYSAMLDAVAQLPPGPARVSTLIEQFISVTVTHRDLQIARLTDPGIRRELRADGLADTLRHRGLQILFGDHPTAEQRTAYYYLLSATSILDDLSALPDDELRKQLLAVARRILPPVLTRGHRPRPAPPELRASPARREDGSHL